MKPRNAISSFAIVVLAMLLMGANADVMAVNFCNGHIVTFSPLAAELNNVYNCTQLHCRGTSDFETKRIADDGGLADIQQWLVWTNNPNTPYTPAQQDPIIQQAKTWANSIRPPSKFIYEINFFPEFTVAASGSSWVIGATITYARCGTKTSPTGPGLSPKG